MPYAQRIDDVWTEITSWFSTGTGDDLINHPANVLELWSDDQLAAIGVWPIIETERPDDPSLLVIGSSLASNEDGRPLRVWTTEPVQLADVIEQQVRLIDAERDRRQQLDLVYDFGATLAVDDADNEIAAGQRALQMRELDQDNWTRLHSLALAACIGGAPETIMPMRCEDNWNVQTTAQQVLLVYAAGGMRNAALLFYAGALKSQVRAAADAAAAMAILPAATWPS